MAMKLASSEAANGHLDADACAYLWGSSHPGSPQPHGAARFEGTAIDGAFTADRQLWIADRHIEGDGRAPSIKMAVDNGGVPWVGVAYSWGSQSCHFARLGLDGDGLATHGLYANHCNGAHFRAISVSNTIGAGFHLKESQSLRAAESLSVYNCGAGFEVDGCNGLHGSAWRVKSVTGNGATFTGAAPYVGDMSVHGLIVETVGGDGIVVDIAGPIPLVLGGQIRAEGVSGKALVVTGGSVVHLTGAPNLRSNGDCIHVTGNSRLDITAPTYLDCYVSGQAPRVVVDAGSTLNAGLNDSLLIGPAGETVTVVRN